MPINHSPRRLGAWILLELMIALSLTATIILSQFEAIQASFKRMLTGLIDQNQRTERFDIYHAIIRDLSDPSSAYVGSCCFKTDNFNICYESHQNQFRRKKKRPTSARYYTHTIGKSAAIQTISCNSLKNGVQITLHTTTDYSYDWFFYLDQS